MTNPNDPAINDLDYMSSGGHVHDQTYKNLTKREYFAATAMQGLLTINEENWDYSQTVPAVAVGMADALIAELNKEKP